MNVLTYEQPKQLLDAVVAERDTLAAENCIQDFIITAVKDLVRDSEGVIGWHLNGDVASWDEVLPELSHSETPATSAALAEVEAKAIEKFIAKKLKQLEAMHPDTHAFGATAMSIRAQINELQAYVVELREGRV